MVVLRNDKKELFDEIEIQTSFLWLKTKTTYRRLKDGNIFRFKYPDNYYSTGYTEHIEIQRLFEIPTT